MRRDRRGGEGRERGHPEDVLEGLADGNFAPPTAIVTEPRTAATAALDVDVPIGPQQRVQARCAEAVSVIGTEPMISVGIAA